MRLRPIALAAVPLLLFAMACAPQSDGGTATDNSTQTSSGSDTPQNCPTVTEDTLTIATDSPAYEPWFVDDDPSNGKGFESAVAYAVAQQLGYEPSQVTWVKVRFNNSFKPGAKNFDFDINQISITAARAKVVDFSDGYYSAAQAVIALKGSDAATATSLADLKGLRLGAQTGTTSLTAIRDVIQPDTDPLVFQNTNAAKQALTNDQVDAILADLPTAFYITAVEIPKGTIVGQFQPETGEQEQFGMLLEKGNPLVACVNDALGEMKDSGELADIEKKWLSDTVKVPVLQ
ncbi:MAG: ABC transporter substrate-binding protein [Nocardioidaceae bacterium]